MSDYIQELEKQNEELRQLLAAKETELAVKEETIVDLDKQLQEALDDVNYYRNEARDKGDRDYWNSP